VNLLQTFHNVWPRTAGQTDHPARLVVAVVRANEVVGEVDRADHPNGIEPAIPPNAARD
jgi:hypothetical protein